MYTGLENSTDSLDSLGDMKGTTTATHTME
jgi:hypothetical protein